jgi:hypothetical protein
VLALRQAIDAELSGRAAQRGVRSPALDDDDRRVLQRITRVGLHASVQRVHAFRRRQRGQARRLGLREVRLAHRKRRDALANERPQREGGDRHDEEHAQLEPTTHGRFTDRRGMGAALRP